MADVYSFHNNNQEGIHALMHLFCNRGTPRSIRHLNSYSGHTYKLTKDVSSSPTLGGKWRTDVLQDGTFYYVKIHIKSNQGVENLTEEEAVKLAGEQPDYHTADLYDAIAKGAFPSWTVYFQVMEPKDAETYRWNIFDMTKVWPHADYPLIPVGRLTLNKNVSLIRQFYERSPPSPTHLTLPTRVSRPITSPTLNKQHSPLPTWSAASLPPPIPCCRRECLPTTTPPATVSV